MIKWKECVYERDRERRKDWKLKPGFHEMNPDSSGSMFPTCWGQQSELYGGEQLTRHEWQHPSVTSRPAERNENRSPWRSANQLTKHFCWATTTHSSPNVNTIEAFPQRYSHLDGKLDLPATGPLPVKNTSVRCVSKQEESMQLKVNMNCRLQSVLLAYSNML